jgi:DNA uptake protein ComE-like DNA-binding protein
VLGLPLPLERADAADLALLPGIGPRLAGAIVRERDRGAVESAADLERVRGIGPARAAGLRGSLFVGPDPACDRAPW